MRSTGAAASSRQLSSPSPREPRARRRWSGSGGLLRMLSCVVPETIPAGSPRDDPAGVRHVSVLVEADPAARVVEPGGGAARLERADVRVAGGEIRERN